MATGDLIKLGTLYLGGTKRNRPTNPISGGNSHAFSAGHVIEIRNTESADADKMQWREVNDGGKKYLVGDRVPIHSVSWDDLHAQSLIFGKVIKIDGQDYKLRSLTGGEEKREGGVGSSYAGGKLPNEWDRWIVNEAGLPGLPIPNATDLAGANQAGAHNQMWNWHEMRSWAQETYLHSGSLRANRGNNSARNWNYNTSSSRNANIGFRPVLEVLNSAPTISVVTSNDRTLYESDAYAISGTATDTDAGDVVMVKYKINNGTARTIASPVSTGAEFPFNRSLTFKEGKLFDGATAVTSALSEGTQHVLTVWAEDDKGGKSAEQTRTFYVVPNRPPTLSVDPITHKTDMIDSDSFEIKGTVNNPDANGVKVHYKIGNSAFNEVYTSEGAGGEFSFRVTLSQLTVGPNSLTVRATDHFGAVDTKTITITKAGNVIPLKTAVTRYKLTPPNGTAKGVLLWIERETGDLVVDAEISMTAAGEPENFQPMTKSATAFVRESIEEDEFTFDAAADKSNIILKITQTRTSTASEKGITLITGVFA